MDNITWAVNQLRNVERRPVTVKSVRNILSIETIFFSSEDTICSALMQMGYRPEEVR